MSASSVETEDGVECISNDPIISSDLTALQFPTRSLFKSRPISARIYSDNAQAGPSRSHGTLPDISERDPLLDGSTRPTGSGKKPFYRPRPLWIVPFAMAAALARGMTLAPRVEVFTQLSCEEIYRRPIDYNHTLANYISPSLSNYSSNFVGPVSIELPYSTSILPYTHSFSAQSDELGDEEDDPMHLPTQKCISDPAVQSGAARLQAIMTTTMGTLSAATTGWWGHFGERHGRTWVMVAATIGLMLTDLTFILVSTPHSPFAAHGHKLIIIAPIIEGMLGGWTTLQAATSAYISDCTSDGSRAQIFSRFTGVFYLGFAIGPAIGAYVIRNPPSFPFIPPSHGKTVAPVFWVALLCSFVNFLLAVFVFPESLSKGKRASNVVDEAERPKKQTSGGFMGFVKGFVKPLKVFLPKLRKDQGLGQRRDWNLTFLALALFGYMLSLGLFQLKYLYAEHIYGWDSEKLSYYISFVGGARALHLLFLLPFIISFVKPKAPPPSQAVGPSTSKSGKKPKPTKAQLASEMSFDLTLSRLSLLVDIMSHSLVSISSTAPTAASQAAFVGFTVLSCFGSGIVPSIQSLALCIMQSDQTESQGEPQAETGGTGSLFGAFSVLQATGQMILGPMLFGLVYSSTVAKFPKAIFMLAAACLIFALAFLCLVRSPQTPDSNGRKKKARVEVDVERGRSRVSKDLSGGLGWANNGRQALPSQAED